MREEKMNIINQLNSAPMYLICGSIVAFVALVCVIFLVRAYKTGAAIGMDTKKMKQTMISSATFPILPYSRGFFQNETVNFY